MTAFSLEGVVRHMRIYPAATTNNPAVNRCHAAAAQVYEQYLKSAPDSEFAAARYAGTAYRNAMPALDSRESIRNFIACVTHGMLLCFLEPDEGPRLLYGAHMALAALPREEPHKALRPGRPPKAEADNRPREAKDDQAA